MQKLFANTIEVLKEGDKVKKKVVPISEFYFSEDSGYGIYNVELTNGVLYVMKGKFPGSLVLGNTYEIEGDVVIYKGETQFHVKSIQIAKAEGKQAIIYYLQTLHGLKKRAEAIYNVFGEKTIDMLTNRPELVASRMKGIGKTTTLKWSKELKQKAHEEELLLFLFGLGLTPVQVDTLKKTYGNEVRNVLEDNPYRLIQDVRGYGFKKCDTIARNSGIAFNDPKRVRAGVYHTLIQSTFEGHTYLPEGELVNQVQSILCTSNEQMEFDLVVQCISDLEGEGEVVRSENKIFLSHYFFWETRIVKEVERISQPTNWSKTTPQQVENMLDDYLRATGVHLETKQREAVVEFSSKQGGFYILNGSAGCGKTFTLKVILSILQSVYRQNRKEYKVKIMAPTGKASKVASKATGLPCITIHRGLEYDLDGFQRNESNPLAESIIVVDESSMLDTELSKDLLIAVKSGAKVIFLGDTKQLPSVGAGNVLLDLINSDMVHVVTLDVVKRQGAESGIINNANAIIAGEMVSTQSTNDSFVLARNTDNEILKTTLQSYRRLLEKGMHQDEIQVLTPQRKGKLGIYNLNRLFQQEFNPNGKKTKIKNLQLPIGEADLYYRVGDKVIHIQNDIERTLYRKDGNKFRALVDEGITNGECGTITHVTSVTKYDANSGKTKTFDRMIVKYEDWYVFYDSKEDIEMLDHAYALTIHKSQGSQWKAVIQPLSRGHIRMLDNNLLYTGLTRASDFHCFIGDLYVLQRGIETFRVNDRFTDLLYKLAS